MKRTVTHQARQATSPAATEVVRREQLGMSQFPLNGNPHAIVVRAKLPDVAQAFVSDVKNKKRYPMQRLTAEGLFEAEFPRRRKMFAYEIETLDAAGNTHRVLEPENVPPILPEADLKQFCTGQHAQIYEHLGCHPLTVHGVTGAVFAVWAPDARQVSVIGDFNAWDRRRHPMRLRAPWGVWELFIPEVAADERYQFALETQAGNWLIKSDPYARAAELPPSNASLIVAKRAFPWTDEAWFDARQTVSPLNRPISVYEVHLGSWKRQPADAEQFLTYRELAQELIPYAKTLGFTHLELLPLAEHPFYGSWGYQVTGYYAPSSRYGSPEDLMFFVNECHRQGLGVILDWVPAHFPKDDFALGEFDGTCLYEHADPRFGEHKDWGTLIFDYGRNEVKNFLLANAVFWFEQYHVDGIRVDAVASMLYLDYSRKEGEWVPNKYGGRENLEAIAFIKELNVLLHEKFPGALLIAEESTSWLGVTYPIYLGGLNFTLKWNLGWMNDMLFYMSHDPIYRKFVHTMVPFALLYAFHEHFMLELSHDEVVHGKGSLWQKMPGDEWQKFANLRLLYGFMFGHPGKKLLFMGNEFGQCREWNHDRSVDWDLLEVPLHQGLQRFVQALNRLYAAEPALYIEGTEERCFDWIDYHDFESSIFSFMRRTSQPEPQCVICIYNFTPLARERYRIGVPWPGPYALLLNSDEPRYGGQGSAAPLEGAAEAIPWQHQPYSLTVNLPPLGVLILKPAPQPQNDVLAVTATDTVQAHAMATARASAPLSESAPAFLAIERAPRPAPSEESAETPAPQPPAAKFEAIIPPPVLPGSRRQKTARAATHQEDERRPERAKTLPIQTAGGQARELAGRPERQKEGGRFWPERGWEQSAILTPTPPGQAGELIQPDNADKTPPRHVTPVLERATLTREARAATHGSQSIAAAPLAEPPSTGLASHDPAAADAGQHTAKPQGSKEVVARRQESSHRKHSSGC